VEIVALVALSLVVSVLARLGYWRSWERPFWDWLELLIIPVVLGLGAFWFNNQARKSEQELAQDRAREEALQRYLDIMQELILDKGLRRSEKHAEMRDVSRARTLAVLRSLDGDRKGQVVRFLHEAHLIELGKVGERQQVIEAIIYLRDADLSGANLSDAYLRYANLSGAYLSDAKEWNNEQLAQAEFLDGATLPDGTKVTDEPME
jgi:hypothetical protein